MTTSPSNPKIEAIRHNVQSSYDELNQFIAEQLTPLDPAKLYQHPGNDEWTIMESLAHIDEFMPYWANEIEKLVASPGKNFGRTMQDERRLQAISNHGSDTLEQVRATLPDSYGRLDLVLSHLNDSDLALIGHHSRFGDQTLEWFIEEFVTTHLANHLEQMRRCLTAVK
jgi:DinB superfamily